MLKKKKKSPTPQRYSESFIVTRTSFNQALSSKSHESGNLPKKRKRIQHTPFYTADDNKMRAGGGERKGRREVSYRDISNNTDLKDQKLLINITDQCMHSFKIERAQIVLRQIHTRTALALSLPHKAKDIWCVHVIDEKKLQIINIHKTVKKKLTSHLDKFH